MGALLERTDLVRRIDDALARAAFVWLHAPAGYGKSLALDAVLRDREPVARYDAAPWERDAFVEPLVEAVRAVRPEFGRRTLALAAGGSDLQRAGAAFGRDLGHVELPLTIAIDDAAVLGEGFGGFVGGLLRTLPASTRVLVASRGTPPASAGSAVDRGQLVVFGPDALRFGEAELAALAPALDARARATLLERTEGWPAAVVLALRAGEGAPVHGAVAPLVDRLIADLPGDDRLVLERWFVHEHLVAALLDGVARAVLDRLVREGALVTRVSDVYRIHPLVRDAVAARVRREQGEARLQALHAEAARWYDGAQQLGAALYHLQSAKDAALARDLLRRRGAESIIGGHAGAVTAVVQAIGAESLADPALIAYLTGWRLKLEGSVYAKDRFVEAGIVAREAGDEALTFATDVQLVELDLARGRIVTAETAEALVARGRLRGPREHAEAEIRAGWAAVMRHDYAEALALAERARLLGPMQREAAAPLRAYALTVAGRFAEANDELVRAIEVLHDADALVARARMLGWSTRIASLQGERENALADASEAWRIGADIVPRAERASLAIAFADAAVERGELDGVDSALEVAREHADAAWYAVDRRRFPSVIAFVATRATFLRDGPAAALQRGHDALGGTVADVAAHAERLAFAALARTAVPDAFAPAIPVVADAADAVLYAEALRVLRALDRVGRYDEAPLAPFAALLAKRRTGGFTDRLIAALEARAVPVPAPPVAQLDPLTPREREILALLAEGLTNKELAQRLTLGTRTVETHVARILGKLGVPSRSRAIAAYLRSSTDAGIARNA